jgi:hypothetical protein
METGTADASDDGTSQDTRNKDARKDLEDWIPHRSSVQALKEAKIVQSTVPVLSYHEWLEQSGLSPRDFQSGTSPADSQSVTLLRDTEDGSLSARFDDDFTTRQELQRRLDSLRKHHERERKMLLEQAKAGHTALQEAIRLEKSLDFRNSEVAVSQIRSQLASARELADSRTQEVQQLLLVLQFN